MKKFTRVVSKAVSILFVSLTIGQSASAMMPVISVTLLAEPAIVLPPPTGTIIPFPTPAPVPPTITIGGPQPFILPKIENIKWNPEKGGTPCAPRVKHNTKKEAKQTSELQAKKGGGGGGGTTHHPKGKHGPHYHPKGSPVHHYYPKSVVVAKGDSLWSIAQKHGLDHKKLQTLNGIKDPTKLMPGQVIKLGK